MGFAHVQIGEVADRTGLSLRTIRYYEEVKLVTPSGRTAGGFRLYSANDVSRLLLIRRMKPLGFSLDEMRDVLSVLDGLEAAEPGSELDDLVQRLESYRLDAETRVHELSEQLASAESFATELRRELGRQKKLSHSR